MLPGLAITGASVLMIDRRDYVSLIAALLKLKNRCVVVYLSGSVASGESVRVILWTGSAWISMSVGVI